MFGPQKDSEILERAENGTTFLYRKTLGQIMEIKRLTRGRPIGSDVRQNIINLLSFMKEGYGNDIHKIYCEIFPRISKNTLYYHLKKGAELGIFKVDRIVSEKGDFSWGGISEKTYYSNTGMVSSSQDSRLVQYFSRCNK